MFRPWTGTLCDPSQVKRSIHSDVSYSSDDEEEEDEEESNENIMELDRPLTADETRRLAESWKKRYSTDPVASASDGHQDQPQETLHEGKGISPTSSSSTITSIFFSVFFC